MSTRTLVSFVALTLVGCGAGAKVCAVIDLAAHACTVVRYLDEAGTPREVRVTPEEAREFARSVEAKRAAGDAGADGSGK